MLYTIAVILLVMWALGVVGTFAIGAFVHVLLVVAIVLFLVGVITGRRTALLLLLVATGLSLMSVPASAQNRRGGGVTVYVGTSFRGESVTFQDDTPTLVPFGLNDRVSSIQIPQGETWEVCQDFNYVNRCQVLSGSVPDLGLMGWSGRISSLRMVRGAPQGQRAGGGYAPPILIFFDRQGFRGNSRTVTSQMSNQGYNLRGGSMRVQGGATWELCDRTRRCVTVRQDVTDVSRLGLNGPITSVRLLNSQAYDRGNNDRGNNGRGNDGRGYGRQN